MEAPFPNVRIMDVTKYQVTMTDLRTDKDEEVTIYRPDWMGCRDSIISDYARFGYCVKSIKAETVTCPINWANVFEFYAQVKDAPND